MTEVAKHEEIGVEGRLAQSRERLARTIARLEGHVRTSIEFIDVLNREKNDLQRQLDDLTNLFEQEHSNSEQRERLYASSQVEAEERASALARLRSRHEEQEALIDDNARTIERLDGEVAAHAGALSKRDDIERGLREELHTASKQVVELETRVQLTIVEREEYKNLLYAKEREDAIYAVKLTSDERDKATRSIDEILARVEQIESSYESEIRNS